MNTTLRPIGNLPPEALLPRRGLFPRDLDAVMLRRRAVDRAMCRRLGPIRALAIAARSDDAAHRASIALFDHPPAEVAAALGDWARRNQFTGWSW